MTQLEFDNEQKRLTDEMNRSIAVYDEQIMNLTMEKHRVMDKMTEMERKISKICEQRMMCEKAIKEIKRIYWEKRHELKVSRPGVTVKWCRVHEEDERPLPTYESEGAAGMDISAYITNSSEIQWWGNNDNDYDIYTVIQGVMPIDPGERALIPTGWKVQIPKGYEMQLRPRSGNAIKLGLSFVNCVGTIDSDYRGEVMVEVVNLGGETLFIAGGMKIAQCVIAKIPAVNCVEVEVLDETERGEGGFGSTDKQSETAELSRTEQEPNTADAKTEDA